MLEVLELVLLQSVPVDGYFPIEDDPLALSTPFRPGFLIKIKFPFVYSFRYILTVRILSSRL